MDVKKIGYQPIIFIHIRISDDALTQWIIKNRLEKVKNKTEQENSSLIRKEGGRGGRILGVKTGQHESKHKFGLYMDIYTSLKKPYDDEKILMKWNNVF